MKESRLAISSQLFELEELYNWLEKLLRAHNIEGKTQRNILLVVQEMVTNSILYGNQNISSKEVSIEVFISSTSIIIEVQDEGEGLKKLPSKEESKELDYLAENGRGLKLAVLMTESIELDGNKMRLIFKNE